MEFKKCGTCGKKFPKTTEHFYKKGNKLDFRCKKCANKRREINRKKQAERGELKKAKERAKKRAEKRAKQLLMKSEIDKLKRIASNHRYYQECNECGRWFFNRLRKKTCSIKCENRRQNRHRGINRRRKIRENGRIDWNINIQRLMQRDGLTCHICGEQVELDDFHTNDNGLFVVGKMYPSIDHVKPVSKGGTHTWDNVKIAHMICNSVKSNKRVYRNGDGQTTVAF